jgi:hypothetical protein
MTVVPWTAKDIATGPYATIYICVCVLTPQNGGLSLYKLTYVKHVMFKLYLAQYS